MFLKKTHVETSNKNGLEFFHFDYSLNMNKTCWMPITWLPYIHIYIYIHTHLYIHLFILLINIVPERIEKFFSSGILVVLLVGMTFF